MPTTTPLNNIAELDSFLSHLSSEEQTRLEQIFSITIVEGRLVPPLSMYKWIDEYFGSVEAVKNQKIIKITNLVTYEGSLFNELRLRRPVEVRDKLELREEIEKNIGDPLCHPEEGTPEDIFGRLYGKHCTTASNIAKYDGFHGLVVFQEHNPLQFNLEMVLDYFEVALQWGQRANQADPQARYLLLMWNCLWKSGASLLHGHLQMSLGRDMHYPKVEWLRSASAAYQKRYGSNYFEDLYAIHHSLGCSFPHGDVRIISYITPVKEKEVLILSPQISYSFKETIYKILVAFQKALGVLSFNLVIYMPPLGPVEEDWNGFPVMARLVDRGDPRSRNSDIGAMELYAGSVIGSDPVTVCRLLRGCLEDNSDRC